MATKKEKQALNAIGLGLAAYGIYSLMRARKAEQMAGFGAPLDDDDFHGHEGIPGEMFPVGEYGSADDASLWSYFPGNQQTSNIPLFPTKAGYLRGMAWTPYGPILTHPGMYSAQAHPGLSYSQWLSVNLHRHENPEFYEGYGAYGDACSRLQRKYKKQRKTYRKKERQFADRGRRFLGIRVGDGSKRLARLKRKYEKTKAKAESKACEWVGAKQRARQLEESRAEETRIEQQMAQEFQEGQANIARVSEVVAAQQAQAGVNPLLILGGVGAVAVVLLLTMRKRQ